MPKRAPALLRPLVRKVSNTALTTLVNPQLKQHMDYWEGELAKSEWFAGNEFTGADIQMSFPLEAAAARGDLLAGFVERQTAIPSATGHQCRDRPISDVADERSVFGRVVRARLAGVAESVAVYRERRDATAAGINAIPSLSCRLPEGAFYLYADISAFGGDAFLGGYVIALQQLFGLVLVDVHQAPGVSNNRPAPLPSHGAGPAWN